MSGEIKEVYEELGQVLNHPEAFGLGAYVPRPLAARLESTRRMLRQAIRESKCRLMKILRTNWHKKQIGIVVNKGSFDSVQIN